MNARPSTREILLAGQWLLRLEGGATRRVNAVNPLRATSYDPRPIIDTARKLYHAHEQPCLFRVPSIAAGLDAWLDHAQFSASGEVATLWADLDDPLPSVAPEIEVTSTPNEAWLAAKFRLTPQVGAAPLAYRAMASAILLPKAFVAFRQEDRIVGVAYGAVHDRLLVIESVAVDVGVRRRGYGRRLVATLMAWARDGGAREACLQVGADNVPALALYRSLGFGTEVYRYHYRCETGYRPPDTVRIEPNA